VTRVLLQAVAFVAAGLTLWVFTVGYLALLFQPQAIAVLGASEWLVVFALCVSLCWLAMAVALLRPVSGYPRAFIATNPIVHALALPAIALYGVHFLSQPTGGSLAVVIAVIVVAASFVLTLSVCVHLIVWSRATMATASIRTATVLTALGTTAVFVTLIALARRNWDLAGIIVMVGGAAVALVFLCASACCAIVGCLHAAANAAGVLRRAATFTLVAVTAYALVAMNRYALSALWHRSRETSTSMPAAHGDVRHVATLTPAEVRLMRASTEQYWGGYCCVDSPDHLHVAYVRHDASGHETLYVDDRALGDYHVRDQMSFSPDGKRFAYIAAESAGADRQLYVDGQLLAGGVSRALAFTFAPDSARLVYVADRSANGDRRSVAFIGSLSEVDAKPVLVDQRLVTESTVLQAFSFRFNADGTHLLFVEGPEIITDAHGAYARFDYYITIDGRRVPLGSTNPANAQTELGPTASFADGGAYVCSTQSVRYDRDVAYIERRVLDLEGSGVALDYASRCHSPVREPSNTPLPFPSMWDPDDLGSGDHHVRATRAGSLMRIVVDDQPQPLFDMVWPPWFAPDGSELRYGAVDRDRLLWIRTPLASVAHRR
jgi:hypothetical protein